MAKSNKFDYSSRSSTGLKQGAICAKDLRKKAESAKKEAEKSRKHTEDSNHNHLDIHLPGKDLTDEGFLPVAQALNDVIENGDADTTLQLVDLKLCGNQLTVHSLALLAPIIRKAAYTLNTLDLSSNNFSVNIDNEQEAHDFQTFLESFGKCHRLRRLDLSNNPLSDSGPFELIARTYANEQPIDIIPPGGFQSTISLPENGDQYVEDTSSEPTVTAGSVSSLPLRNTQRILCKHGLRSLPYLTLRNTSLDDAGALFLSYALEEHQMPLQLVDHLNAPPANTRIPTYAQGAKGWDWEGNTSTLSRDGLQLLKLTEAARVMNLETDDSPAGSLIDSSMLESYDLMEETNHGIGGSRRRDSRATPQHRRSSLRSSIGDVHGDKAVNDLDSARKRIQRSILEKTGPMRVELWRGAMRLTISSRGLLVLFNTCKRAKEDKARASEHCSSPVVPQSSGCRSAVDDSLARISIHDRQRGSRASYTARVALTKSSVPDDPPFAMTEVTNTRKISKVSLSRFGAKKSRPSANSYRAASLDSPELPFAPVKRVADPKDYKAYQLKRVEASPHTYPGSVHTPSHLPRRVLENIFGYLMSEREMNVLSERQKERVLRWAFDRKTLAMEQEHEWRRKDNNVQIWMLLDSMGCLNYEE
ncbi:hypothetical protein LTR66_012701 [Elasticomyces elasticus]|nr:hypothetical protein LTR66_012701 [Elasticomyces elasticus]